MTPPSRTTSAGRAYLELQRQARREGRPTQQLFTTYALERWLARLAASGWSTSFVLKGGVLLATLGARRPTVDADALVIGIAADEAAIAAVVREVAAMPDPDGEHGVDDGIEFLTESLTTRVIREGDLYEGVRVVLTARLATASIKVSLDVNVGDPVTPGPQRVTLVSVRPGTPPVTLLGYPVETVLAEKIVTAISLGDTNTRVKDYADVWTLTGGRDLDSESVRTALQATAAHRGVMLQPLSGSLVDLAQLRAPAFTAYRRSLASDGEHLPVAMTDVVADVVAFADPLTVHGPAARWEASSRTWR